jgi:hypothetical protein
MKMLVVLTKPLSNHLYSAPRVASYLPLEDLLISFVTKGLKYFYTRDKSSQLPQGDFSDDERYLFIFTLQVLVNYLKRKKPSKEKVAILYEFLNTQDYIDMVSKNEYNQVYDIDSNVGRLGDEVSVFCVSPTTNWMILMIMCQPFCCTSPKCKNPSIINPHKQV